jgi:hypothetical protein
MSRRVYILHKFIEVAFALQVLVHPSDQRSDALLRIPRSRTCMDLWLS